MVNYKLKTMEYRIERKVSFIETGYIEADSVEDLKEKLKTAKLDWDIDVEFNPEIEAITVYDEDGDEVGDDIPANIMEEDFVEAQNGCIIFNEKDFDNMYSFDDDDF